MKFKLSDFVEINPKETLPKYTLAKKIAMEKLQPFCREVSGYDLEKFSGGSKFRNGDTIMARITPCLENGKIAQINILDKEEVGFGSTEFLVFRAKKGFSDPNFIYYLIISELVRIPAIKSMVGSSGRQRVQTSVLENLEIDLPDLETQKKIAKVLSALDDKIELNNQINKNLEEQAQALYQQMFETVPYSSRRICKADECFDISIGKTPPRKEPEWFSFNPTDVNWVSISDMGNCGLYISSSSERLTLDAVKQHNIKMVPDNTVLLSFKLTVGRVAITNGEMTTNEAIAHFKTENKDIVEYLYFYLKGFNFQTMGSTSSIAVAVNSKMIKAMPFVMPDTEKLLQFHSVVGPMFAEIKANQVASNKLKELRDSLLPKLMSGEIDVDNVEI